MSDTLKIILIDAGKIDQYYEETPVNLWRAQRISDTGSIFSLVEKEIVRSNGNIRPTDITIEDQGGEKWVRCKPSPRGISTFDKPDVFKGKSWGYYIIPAGTILPIGLAIVRDNYNARLGATHYSIAPASDMPLENFKALLDQLARLVMLENTKENTK